MRLRVAAQLLGDDIWIAVRLPGAYEGDDFDDDAAIRRWTTVALPNKLGWLREALVLNADTTRDDEEEDDGLEPLR